MRFFDHQAQARTRSRALTCAFALAVAGTVLAVHGALALLWWVAGWTVPRYFATLNIGVALLTVLGGWWIESSNLSGGGEHMARKLGAREVRPGTSFAEQRLSNTVQEVSIAANLPTPRVMVLPRVEAINAFAAGWSARDWVVVVSDGALRWLTRDELQGMVAHECSHLLEGDTLLNMRLAGMVSGLEMLYNFGQAVRDFGSDPDGDGERALAFRRDSGASVGLFALSGLAIMAAGWFGWLAGRLLQAAVTREREFLADARAVQWTRQKDGLGGVLRKIITQRQQGVRTMDLRGPQKALAHLMLDSEAAGDRWLDTHPELTERVRRIYGRRMGGLPLEPVNARGEDGAIRGAAAGF